MKRWTQIFKVLANRKRLAIIKLLANGKEFTVSEIAPEIHVTFTGTSKHLILMRNLDVLESDGKAGHVYYSLNKNLPADLKAAIHLFIK